MTNTWESERVGTSAVPTVLRVPGSGRGYEVLRIVWHVEVTSISPSLAWLALETMLRSPSSERSGATAASGLESQGFATEVGCTPVTCYLELRGPRTGLQRALSTLAESLLGSGISAAALAAARAAVSVALDKSAHSLADQAEAGLLRALAPEGHWLRSPADAGPDTVRTAPPSDVEDALEALRTCRITVVSTEGCPEEWLSPFARTGVPEGGVRPALVPPVVAVRLPSPLNLGVPGPRGAYLQWSVILQATTCLDHVVMEITTHTLGGWSGATWQELFRESHGLTYGTAARTRSYEADCSHYTVGTVGLHVRARDTGRALALLSDRAERLAVEGVAHDEIAACGRQLRGAEALYADASRKAVLRAAQPVQCGLGGTFSSRRLAALDSLDPAAVDVSVRTAAAAAVIVIAVGEGTAP